MVSGDLGVREEAGGSKWADPGKRGEWDGTDPLVAVSVEWEEQGGSGWEEALTGSIWAGEWGREGDMCQCFTTSTLPDTSQLLTHNSVPFTDTTPHTRLRVLFTYTIDPFSSALCNSSVSLG